MKQISEWFDFLFERYLKKTKHVSGIRIFQTCVQFFDDISQSRSSIDMKPIPFENRLKGLSNDRSFVKFGIEMSKLQHFEVKAF